MVVRYILIVFFLADVFLVGVACADDSHLKSDRSQCYSYLTEMVRGSNFPFVYVEKEKINLLIDDDQGETVVAQLVFDTDGSGTAGWIKYNVQGHELLNISADLEEPQQLHYEKQYAEQYERCINND